MRYPDRIGEKETARFNRRHEDRIVAAMEYGRAHTTENICRAAFPAHAPIDPYSWHTTLGRLNSLQRRGVVVRVGPKSWRRSWLAPKDGWR